MESNACPNCRRIVGVLKVRDVDGGSFVTCGACPELYYEDSFGGDFISDHLKVVGRKA